VPPDSTRWHCVARVTLSAKTGGCIVALMPRQQVAQVRAAIEARYRAPDGAAAQVWVCQACDGVGLHNDS
jgi:galactokinase